RLTLRLRCGRAALPRESSRETYATSTGLIVYMRLGVPIANGVRRFSFVVIFSLSLSDTRACQLSTLPSALLFLPFASVAADCASAGHHATSRSLRLSNRCLRHHLRPSEAGGLDGRTGVAHLVWPDLSCASRPFHVAVTPDSCHQHPAAAARLVNHTTDGTPTRRRTLTCCFCALGAPARVSGLHSQQHPQLPAGQAGQNTSFHWLRVCIYETESPDLQSLGGAPDIHWIGKIFYSGFSFALRAASTILVSSISR
uniref:Secreted protein n=1 Tax=Macrostomum lignano TaxID=282301 RepID=A0A1I8F4H6_9PLAT